MKFNGSLKFAVWSWILLLVVHPGYAQREKLSIPADVIYSELRSAESQYAYMVSKMPPGRFARTFENDTLFTVSSSGWVSGFYPGTLLYLYEFSGNKQLLDDVRSRLDVLEKEKDNTTTHDLGFMLYCSFGNAYRLFGDPKYKSVLLTGAASLATRFNPTVGCIRSWDETHGNDWKFPVIVDNMMNLELLNWAYRESKDKRFWDVSITHANTTMKNHFRKDYSSYHVIDYDPETGAVRNKHTFQGAEHESAWARGQAWGLYGYTVMYRDSRKTEYLKMAKNIARFIITNLSIPADKIPWWDYSRPGEPRDASSAAITASALLELAGMVGKKEADRYIRYAEDIIRSLSAAPYKAEPGTNGGFILKHSSGNLPQGREIDVPLSYADYYYVETLIRYKNLLEKGRIY